MTNKVEFMVKLCRLNSSGRPMTDILVLWTISKNPGIAGNDIPRKLGLKTRSQVQHAIKRLLDQNLIEDRRERTGKYFTGILHIKPAGETVLSQFID